MALGHVQHAATAVFRKEREKRGSRRMCPNRPSAVQSPITALKGIPAARTALRGPRQAVIA